MKNTNKFLIAIILFTSCTITNLALANDNLPYIKRDTGRVFFVQVDAEGITADLAIENGFKRAVEQAVGSLVLSEFKVKDDQVLKNEIIKYSAGYIESYKIISQTIVDSKFKIVMNVWVGESKIADRLGSFGKNEGDIDGARASAQIKSLLSQKNQADALLEKLTKNFPQDAFNATIKGSEVLLNGRTPEIIFVINIEWRKEYFEAIAEALERTREGKSINPQSYGSNQQWGSVIAFKRKGDWLPTIASFKDPEKKLIFIDNISNNKPRIKVSILDVSGQAIGFQCFENDALDGRVLYDNRDRPRPILPFYEVNPEYKDFALHGEVNTNTKITYKIPAFSQIVDKMSKSKIEVVRANDCR